MSQNKIVVFESKKIRRIWHNEEWYFSVVDVVEALTDSPTPRQYWGKVKQRAFIDLQLSPIWVQLDSTPAKALHLRKGFTSTAAYFFCNL